MDESDIFKEEGYELAERLADDCWGELHRAVYLPHRREVLFRRFPSVLGEDPDAWSLAEAEIKAWARLDHPGILQALDWGLTGSGPFLASEMPAGLQLAQCLDSGEAPGYEELFGPLLEAVEHARRLGALHLGLSPRNVWVARGEGACRVQVAEFGLWYVCRRFPDALPTDDAFLAPEQHGEGKASAASDVYSLGLLLASVVAGGSGPDRAGDRSGIVDAHFEGPPELASVVACCLSEQPLARYATAGELAGALGLSTEPHEDDAGECPICRLKDEIGVRPFEGRSTSEAGRSEDSDPHHVTTFRASTSKGLPGRYAWLMIAALALATLLVWWAAFR
ncbi:MAG: protein kinase [Actinobacteria bacterium]|nr:protein kinase [Actinomycetota bacterium]MBU1944575.1 protein kinase [Actinomycetota bacterium]MBU2689128.1 protein kinase [Actinomycetota bacterium]